MLYLFQKIAQVVYVPDKVLNEVTLAKLNGDGDNITFIN